MRRTSTFQHLTTALGGDFFIRQPCHKIRHQCTYSIFTGCLIILQLLAGCTTAPSTSSSTAEDRAATAANAAGAVTIAAALVPVSLVAGERLQVAVTTSLIGDVVARVGGEEITLFTLIEPGVDPHSYTTTPQALRTLRAVDLIFINGFHLEEGLADALAAAGPPLVSVNELVTPLINANAASHEATDNVAGADEHIDGVDPHTWQSVPNVQRWVETIETAFSTLDPIHADGYHANAKAYQQELQALDQEIRRQVNALPPESRKLVTDHETLDYFAHEYGFMISGSLVHSLSSSAESSAQEFAALQDQLVADGVPAIFVGNTTNPALAQQLAHDLGITVVPLYTDALSDSTGPAATYLDFMRYNVNAIVTALGER